MNKRDIKRYPAKQPTVKLEIHESILLYNPLKHLKKYTKYDYTGRIASIISEDLYRQKISLNQIIIKSLLTSSTQF